MITKQDMEKVIVQVNSILASMQSRIEELERKVEEKEAPKKMGRPRKVDSEVSTN